MSNEKVTSGQSLSFGGKVAGILHALGTDKKETQFAIDDEGHPVWAKLTTVLSECLVKVEEVKEEIKETILEWLADISIPAQTEFVVAEKFTKSNPDVKFWYFGNNFETWFLPLTEKAVEESLVGIGKLRIPANLAEMTPEQPAPRITTTSQFYWMMSQQPRGEKPNGKNRRLLVDGSANLFRVIDVNGEERAVFVGWDGGLGWFVCARELGHVFQWGAGDQVISRKSVLQTLESLAPAA